MESLPRRELLDELKSQWKSLWLQRIDDKVRAEGIADNDYSRLFIDKGTVIFATKDFRLPDFKEILELNGVLDAAKIIPPSPHVGGWGKFIRTSIAGQKRRKRTDRTWQYLNVKKAPQQLKKGGRGWLHF